jgi:hypothetical protein
LLGNDSVNTSRGKHASTIERLFAMGVRAATVDMQWCGKHASTIERLVFFAWSVPRSYLEDKRRYKAVEGNGNERIFIAKIRYQRTSSEAIAEE